MQVDTGAFQNLAAEVAALGARLDAMDGSLRAVARAALQLDGASVPDQVPVSQSGPAGASLGQEFGTPAARRVGKHADRHGLHVAGGRDCR
jgi:hypothetical protein